MNYFKNRSRSILPWQFEAFAPKTVRFNPSASEGFPRNRTRDKHFCFHRRKTRRKWSLFHWSHYCACDQDRKVWLQLFVPVIDIIQLLLFLFHIILIRTEKKRRAVEEESMDLSFIERLRSSLCRVHCHFEVQLFNFEMPFCWNTCAMPTIHSLMITTRASSSKPTIGTKFSRAWFHRLISGWAFWRIERPYGNTRPRATQIHYYRLHCCHYYRWCPLSHRKGQGENLEGKRVTGKYVGFLCCVQ